MKTILKNNGYREKFIDKAINKYHTFRIKELKMYYDKRFFISSFLILFLIYKMFLSMIITIGIFIVTILLKKLHTFTYMFYHLKHIYPLKQKLIIYKTLVDSILDYGLNCWIFLNKCQIDNINKLILKNFNSIYINYKNETSEQNLRIRYKYKILKIEEIFIYKTILNNFYKIRDKKQNYDIGIST